MHSDDSSEDEDDYEFDSDNEDRVEEWEIGKDGYEILNEHFG